MLRIYITKGIAAVQVFGASAGLNVLISNLTVFERNLANILLFTIMTILALGGLVAGFLFWSQTRIGFIATAIMQALQVPVVVSSIVSYKIIFGLGASLYIVGQPPLLTFTIGAETTLYAFGAPDNFVIAINVVAVLALAYLIFVRRFYLFDNNSQRIKL